MQTICFFLTLLSVVFIMQTIRGLRFEADIIANLHYQQRLGFNKETEIKEARRSVNKYIFTLVMALICDIVFLNVLFN